MLATWIGFDACDDDKRVANDTMLEDFPGVLEDFLYTSGDRNLKKEIPDFYF